MQRAIAAALGVAPEEAETAVPIVIITTTGDRVQDRRLLEIGGKALFTKEIEEALIDGRVDCAVHSMKDVPAERQPGLVIAAVPEREDVRDAFISLNHEDIASLPQGARLGTASLRRQAQCLYLRPDLEPVLLRGNVDTRLAKLADGAADAEAVWAKALNHAPSALTVTAERGALEALEGSCRTAMGAYARIDGHRLTLVVEALTPDGAERFRRHGECPAKPEDARRLGRELGEAVKVDGGDRLVL